MVLESDIVYIHANFSSFLSHSIINIKNFLSERINEIIAFEINLKKINHSETGAVKRKICSQFKINEAFKGNWPLHVYESAKDLADSNKRVTLLVTRRLCKASIMWWETYIFSIHITLP
jgi:hypothetical protein